MKRRKHGESMLEDLPWAQREITPERFDTRLAALAYVLERYGDKANLLQIKHRGMAISQTAIKLRSGVFDESDFQLLEQLPILLTLQRERIRKQSKLESFDRMSERALKLSEDIQNRWRESREHKLHLLNLAYDASDFVIFFKTDITLEQQSVREKFSNEVLSLLDSPTALTLSRLQILMDIINELVEETAPLFRSEIESKVKLEVGVVAIEIDFLMLEL